MYRLALRGIPRGATALRFPPRYLKQWQVPHFLIRFALWGDPHRATALRFHPARDPPSTCYLGTHLGIHPVRCQCCLGTHPAPARFALQTTAPCTLCPFIFASQGSCAPGGHLAGGLHHQVRQLPVRRGSCTLLDELHHQVRQLPVQAQAQEEKKNFHPRVYNLLQQCVRDRHSQPPLALLVAATHPLSIRSRPNPRSTIHNLAHADHPLSLLLRPLRLLLRKAGGGGRALALGRRPPRPTSRARPRRGTEPGHGQLAVRDGGIHIAWPEVQPLPLLENVPHHLTRNPAHPLRCVEHYQDILRPLQYLGPPPSRQPRRAGTEPGVHLVGIRRHQHNLQIFLLLEREGSPQHPCSILLSQIQEPLAQLVFGARGNLLILQRRRRRPPSRIPRRLRGGGRDRLIAGTVIPFRSDVHRACPTCVPFRSDVHRTWARSAGTVIPLRSDVHRAWARFNLAATRDLFPGMPRIPLYPAASPPAPPARAGRLFPL